MKNLWARAGTVWLAILAVAVANGALREALLVPIIGSAPGLFASGLLLCALILLVAHASSGWVRPRSRRRAWGVGALWLGLTVLFEFAFGALVQGKDLPELLSAYHFHDGNLWPAVLLVVLVAPVLAYRMHSRRVSPSH